MESQQGRISVEAEQQLNPLPLQLNSIFWVSTIGYTFGYEFGVTGGLLSMPPFLNLFFPDAYKKMMSDSDTLFGDFVVNLYLSSMYQAAFISAYTITIFRIHTFQKMRISLWLMMIGILTCASGLNLWVITFGRILFGIAISIVIQLVPSHVSETAPTGHRRHAMMLFPLAISFGIFDANSWFYLMRIPMIWNYLGFTGLFCLVLLDFCITQVILITDDDHPTIFLGYTSKDTKTLANNIGLMEAAEGYSAIISPSSIIFENKYRPSLVMVICISIFQQLTGIYAFMIYAPFLFKAIGLGEIGSLLCSTGMFLVNWIVTRVLFATIDKFERRTLFMQGGIVMLICQIIITTSIIRVEETLPWWNAFFLVVAMIVYVAGFAWSWGPLGWLVPSEILHEEIQPIGYSLYVSINMICMFFVTQFFTMGLCKMRFYMHLVILSSVLLMTIFVHVFLPETKGVQVENLSKIWKTHWFWRKFVEE